MYLNDIKILRPIFHCFYNREYEERGGANEGRRWRKVGSAGDAVRSS